jgi:ATP-dependent RNA circularization protein (DNA/RNA ligase family)
MSDFFRFPHTPHLAWLGQGNPRDDKVLSRCEVDELLGGEVIVEEKLDGANLGLSVAPGQGLRAQNRGQYLEPPYSGQFSRLGSWLAGRETALAESLGVARILFGEWCAARHSVAYDALPDWFLAFDVYDREVGGFWSTELRDRFVKKVGLRTVPTVFVGRTTLDELKTMLSVGHSAYGDGPMEGIVVRRESGDALQARAKLVRADFTQAITEHWSRRQIEWNRVRHNLSTS